MIESQFSDISGGKHQSLDASLSTIFYLEDASVDYGDITALKNIHFRLELGEIVFVTGASGAGKTTFIKLLSGDLIPTSGKSVRGKPLFISQVFQDLKLLNTQSVKENCLISYDPTIYKSKKIFFLKFDELVDALGMNQIINQKIYNLNGGMKQKVAIVRALLCQPEIFIADELTSSLDFENAKVVFDILNHYNVKKKMTIVWATHNKELVKSFTGRVVHLDRGKLIYSGHACFI